MSRLTDLLHETRKLNPDLAAALESEVRHLQERRAYGLNFERHTPEAVDLYGRPVRVGDKVRMLPPRGTTESVDKRLWTVTGGERVKDHIIADLRDPATGEIAKCPRADLVVVAESRDVIYPGLVSTGKIERGADKPFHTVINGENLHALRALLYTHRGKIDAIYIDPPYNTGARDWKYNNDYVAEDDLYRHSKWLAFMERRLVMARELLNPASSALIVTIDEKEVHRLALLLEQIFSDAHHEMVTTVISAKGVVRKGQFSRVEEHIFVLTFGDAKIEPNEDNMLSDEERGSPDGSRRPIEWLGLRRREPSSVRGARPNQFYPIFVSTETHIIQSIGKAIGDGVDRRDVQVPPRTVAIWPEKPDGTEMLWGLTPEAARRHLERGYLKISWNKKKETGVPYYLPGGTVSRIASGEIEIIGKGIDGSVVGFHTRAETTTPPKRVWNRKSHNAETGGTNLVSVLLDGRRFPYPKSLYAVEDILRFLVGNRPDAVILDFFSGSGTTAHATMRLNRGDGGVRQCISITNNEVSAVEQSSLRDRGLRPGDQVWENLGICEHITKPRVTAAITGKTPTGQSVRGSYNTIDNEPISQGLPENVEFFTLTYEAPLPVASNHEFARIAPLLWLRAGARGQRIKRLDAGWDVAESYGVIQRLEHLGDFVDQLTAKGASLAFVITDDERRFQTVCSMLPEHVEPIRLYESYLRNFQIDAQRSTR